MSKTTAPLHLWLNAKPGHRAQRLRERRRRQKPDSRREYRIRRSQGRTVRLSWNNMPGERR